mmetsp:Transcript_5534/g.11748  ORF Transcript_5534/g.11748 Transcript_5534/m.11748 type:complete len:214 (-) Transcript_5534:92-733(-)
MDFSTLRGAKGSNVIFHLIVQLSFRQFTASSEIGFGAFQVFFGIEAIGFCQIFLQAKGSIIFFVTGVKAVTVFGILTVRFTVFINIFADSILLVRHSFHVVGDKRVHVHNVISVLGRAPSAFFRVTRVHRAKTKSHQALGHDADLIFVAVFIGVAVPLLHMMATLEFDGVITDKVIVAIFSIVQTTRLGQQRLSCTGCGGKCGSGSGRQERQN